MTKVVAIHAIEMPGDGEKQFTGEYDREGNAMFRRPRRKIAPVTLFDLADERDLQNLLENGAVRYPTQAELLAESRAGDEQLEGVLTPEAVRYLSNLELATRDVASAGALIG